jgi:transposase
VIDDLGRILDTAAFAATRDGYRCRLEWLGGFGELVAVGVEGCGSWGAGLSRSLAARGVRVVEVNRPNRQNRRRRGKSDTVDAEAAARAVLAGDATVTPKTGTGPVEALRQLRVVRAGAMKARTAAGWRPTTTAAPEGASRYALASVARRWRALALEIAELDRRIKTILDDIAAPLIAVHGVGYDTAGQLLVTAGDNPERLRHNAPTPRSVAPPRSRSPQARPTGTGSTAAATATPTRRCGASSSCA